MEPLRLSGLARVVRGRLDGASGTELVRGVSIDSRSIDAGSLFVALPGAREDGHHFLAAAFARGASAALVRRDWSEPIGHLGATCRVDDPRRALRDLAHWCRLRLRARVVAITGSAGKTTTKDLLAHLLEGEASVHASPRSFNNDLGVPLTLLGVEPSDAYAIVEVGISHVGEMAPLAATVRPDVAVLTAVGPAHLEGLGTVAGVLREKSRLFETLAPDGAAVVPFGESVVRSARRAGARRVVTFGETSRATVHGRALPPDEAGTPLFLFRGRTVARLFAPGRAPLRNALAALAAAEALGIDPGRLLERLGAFRPRAGRLGRFRAGAIEILDDAYNANPLSVEAGLDALERSAVAGRRIAVLGAMGELGARGPALHRAIGRLVARSRVSILVTIGRDAAEAAGGARASGMNPARVLVAESIESAVAALAPRLRPGDLVWVKASRSAGLERFVESLAHAGRSVGERLQEPSAPRPTPLQVEPGPGLSGGKGEEGRLPNGTVEPVSGKGGSFPFGPLPPGRTFRRFRRAAG